MSNTVPEAASSWRFDYKLNISTLITIVSAIIAIASMGATLQKRLEVVEHTNHVISMELKETRLTALQVARIETRLDAVHNSIASLRDEIRSNRNKAH
ncbi:MAG: hypothetical protein R3Y11_02315 [Pseudomonadota bacterium]